MLWAAALCALFTAPVAWNAREGISNDGLSYLEVAANALRLGPVHLLSNAYWSPAYPALLAVALKVAHPTLASELAVVHSVDWVICVFEYLCFTYFLWNLLRWIQLTHPGVIENKAGFRAILVFVYTLLFVSNLDISLWFVGPNVLMAASVYLTAAICVRLSLPDTRDHPLHLIWLGFSVRICGKSRLVSPFTDPDRDAIFATFHSRRFSKRSCRAATDVHYRGVSPDCSSQLHERPSHIR